MQKYGDKPIIRKSYDFRAEPVHFETDPEDQFGALPRHTCRRCDRSLPQDQFGPLSGFKPISKRVTKWKLFKVLHPYCFKCRNQERGVHAQHPLYSPALDRFFQKLIEGARGGAAARGILFGISKDDALGLFLEQGGICALSGIEMDWKTPGSRGRNGRNLKAPSIDRINSSGNYTLGNIQIVMQITNIMKNDLPMEYFVGLCRRIADHKFTL